MGMGIVYRDNTNVGEQAMLLDGFDIVSPNWGICGHSLNWSFHEGISNMSSVKVHKWIDSGNVNVIQLISGKCS